METLIDELPARGGRVVQAEDEIAALGMVLGASFGGVPAMTATSGPGLSLMTEMLGLSSMAEIPAVIVDCQRAGPATGMPSRTEQSDLFHAVYGGHGDFPRVVLGVFDVVHAREVMFKAFHLAESYQLPVLVLSDAYIAQRRQIRDARRGPRRARRSAGAGRRATGRRASTLTGDARRRRRSACPGRRAAPTWPPGSSTRPRAARPRTPRMHHEMNAKRFRKLDAIAARDRATGSARSARADAPRGIVAWGSQYGLLREWVRRHPEYRVFLPEILHPFPLAAFEAWRRGSRVGRCVLELSFQGQFHRYLSSLTDLRRRVAASRAAAACRSRRARARPACSTEA